MDYREGKWYRFNAESINPRFTVHDFFVQMYNDDREFFFKVMKIMIRIAEHQYSEKLGDQMEEAFSNILLGEKIPLDMVNAETGEIVCPANSKITQSVIKQMVRHYDHLDIDPSPIRNKIREIIEAFESKITEANNP